ncbi:MAG: MBL fold metallo-hydrolase [Caldilineales bacterium]|nr:MBL fold metallo-hydrolase [Caldilineales bacterium]
MQSEVVYCQINKDYAYWTEKRRVGQKEGGHVCGLLTHINNGEVQQNILIDAGLGTLTGIADSQPDAFWDQPLGILITHGHIDHHAELMVLSEIYCNRRGEDIHAKRPPLFVYCTEQTLNHLHRTHLYGFTKGQTLRPCLIDPFETFDLGVFRITPLPVEDHFSGSVIFVIEFGGNDRHKIIIGWDLKTPPMVFLDQLRAPSLAFFDATTWAEHGYSHISIEQLTGSGFLRQLQLETSPKRQKYGAYLVHYSGWEDRWGMLSDKQLAAKFHRAYPDLAPVVRVARRGQAWRFVL